MDELAPSRPLLRWHGGKWRLAPWIIGHFPPHRVYVEAFGGAASVLLRKPRAYAEIYNDLDDTLAALFRVLRDRKQARALVRALELTPFSRSEFEVAYQFSPDPVEAARRTIVRSFMGFGSDGTNGVYRTGFRSNSNRSGTTPAGDWSNYPDSLRLIISRLSKVTLEHRDAVQVMRAHDGPETLHYVDPPYLPETRSAGNRRGAGYHVYVHDMEADEHPPLLAALRDLKGMVILSGYPSDLYDRELSGWERTSVASMADGARPRTEVLWLNPAATAALRNSGPLFQGVAA